VTEFSLQPSAFSHEIAKNCALQAYHAASIGNSLPTFRDNVSAPYSRVKKVVILEVLILEDGNDRLSRNVGKELPVLAV
jgi:hypothetical protein